MAETTKTVAELEAALKQLEATRSAQVHYATSVAQRLVGQLATARATLLRERAERSRREARAFVEWMTLATGLTAWDFTRSLHQAAVYAGETCVAAVAVVLLDRALRWAFRRWRIRRAKAVRS